MKNKSLISGKQLLSTKFKKLDWLAKDILPPGLTILAGRPKTGKSFLTLYLAAQLTNGAKVFNQYQSTPRNVLFILNEDSERRIQHRLKKSDVNSENIFFMFKSFYFSKGFESELSELISESKAEVIIVDILYKALKLNNTNKNLYHSELELIGNIQNFCRENNKSIIVVHHTRKEGADNPIDKILGTTGISGAADTIWLLDKKSNKSLLNIEGKDVESKILKLKNNFEDNSWSLHKLQYDNLTPEREEILNVLNSEQRPMRTSEISEKIGKKNNTASNLLNKMKDEGLINSPKYGHYIVDSM